MEPITPHFLTLLKKSQVLMARSITRLSTPLPHGHLSRIYLLISKLWPMPHSGASLRVQMPHGGASLRVQMPHGGASERLKMTNLQNKKTIFAYKLIYFYRICTSSNHSLTAKTATFSHTMHIVLSVISRSQVETILKIFAHVGVEPFATFKVSKTELFLTMPHPKADLLWRMSHCGKGEV